ncbi:MAG: L-threonylcarbamoyladenylate synthase [Pseudomonadota bacterium]
MLTINQLKKLVTLLRGGGVVAFPTETVYALAGDARNLSAIKKIFELKNRPLHQPLSVLLPQHYDLEAWAHDVPAIAKRLVDYFWPGPLTLILHKNKSILSELIGGGNKIGLRVPDHLIAQTILEAFSGGLAAPSANRSTRLSPTQADHVRQEFGDKLVSIIDGGACTIGIESTIVDVTTPIPRIRRLGAISQKELQKVIDSEFIIDSPDPIPRVKIPLQQIARDKLKRITCEYLHQGKSVTVLARHTENLIHNNLIWITMPEEASHYARVLYQFLREAEQNSMDAIFVESVPINEGWSGIRPLIGDYFRNRT